MDDAAAANTEFMADEFGDYLDKHTHLQFPHKHNFYHLVYFSKGSGSHAVDFVNFPVQAGQIYFMIPGQVHSWNFKTKPGGFIINFSAAYINALLSNARYLEQFSFFSGIASEQVIAVPAKKQTAIVSILQNILDEILPGERCMKMC
ncbi:MAG: AraC family ligand binding domain-containing protein [Ferruginibacter sp.]